MRQINRDEIIHRLRYALTRFPAALWRDLASRETARARDAQGLAAERLADALGRYEVLSDAPLDHPWGDALFQTAEQRRERGVTREDAAGLHEGEGALGGPRSGNPGAG